ncbi:DctP family TRAP transporter solute-binding subunit [Brevibacillus migulae]|uniref:DctP family TRAP transporter solute-binding subunit n=1 Tax=Brevibacillus migulae TaxID=1644114 RepID=UPI00106E5E21|nr:DctP family TRAP transporter solute-binding subunit [Brevibacillus migulae]
MKSVISSVLLLLLGAMAAFLTVWPSDPFTNRLADDVEQEGLGERIIIKFSHVVAENTPKGLAAEKFAQLAYEKTDGRVEVQVYPNSILYSDHNEMDALMQNEIQMIAPAFSKVATLDSSWLLLDLPFAFLDQQSVDKAFAGGIGKTLFATLKAHGLKGMAFWSNGFKQMTSSRNPLITPEDFAGQRFRIMSSDVLKAQFQVLQASASPIAFNEVYRNIEAGSIDGQENTASNIFTKRLFIGQKYMTISNHGYLGYAVMVNQSFWESLPPDIQQKLEEAMAEATAWNRRQATEMNAQQLAYLTERANLQVHVLTPDERLRWQEAFRPVYARFTPIIGEELMDQLKQLQEQR